MTEPRPVKPATLLLAALVVLLLMAAGTLAAQATDSGPHGDEVPQKLVEPRPGDNVVWPFTSAGHTPDERRLALNVVVHGNADLLRYYLTDRRGATWNETTEAWSGTNGSEGNGSQIVLNDSVIDWGAARGATRYVYVHDYSLTERVNDTTRRPHRALTFFPARENRSGGGRWIDESYQLHDGDYFGKRYHLRVYESPYESDEWVAIQAHSEHWDWFRLRHTVDGMDDARKRVESEFMDSPYVDEVWRKYLGNDGGPNFDGWSTVIELRDLPQPQESAVGGLVVGLLLVGTARGRSSTRTDRRRPRGDLARLARFERRTAAVIGESWATRLLEKVGRHRLLLGLRLISYALLFGSLFGLYLFVRAGGIFVEHRAPWLSPKLIAGTLYLVLVTGLPLCAYWFARRTRPVRSFALASSGIAAAIVLDYAMLAITLLPLQVILHRVGVAVALGLIAAGATTDRSEMERLNLFFGVGILLWVFLLVAPLVGWL